MFNMSWDVKTTIKINNILEYLAYKLFIQNKTFDPWYFAGSSNILNQTNGIFEAKGLFIWFKHVLENQGEAHGLD